MNNKKEFEAITINELANNTMLTKLLNANDEKRKAGIEVKDYMMCAGCSLRVVNVNKNKYEPSFCYRCSTGE